MNLRTVKAARYVTPLREGGSLPAIIEADDEGLYVLKFRGAGQGVKALIAELVSGEIGRTLGLPVPEIVFVDLDPVLGRTEPDPEIQDLIKASGGVNLALDYLPGSITFDPLFQTPDSKLASSVVWFDAFTTNVDRTARNANMLLWHKQIWLIDHGASLYFHHNWTDFLQRSRLPFTQIKDHILLPFTDDFSGIDSELSAKLNSEIIKNIINLIPESWLGDESGFSTTTEHREGYVEYLMRRLEEPRIFVQEVNNARTLHI